MGKLADRIGVTPPTVRSRLKNLVRAEVVRAAVPVNPMKAHAMTLVLVDVSLQDRKILGKNSNIVPYWTA